MRKSLLSLVFLLFFTSPPGNSIAADQEKSPVRVLSDKTDFLIEVSRPRQIHDLLLGLDLIKEMQKISQIQEFQRTTNFRRFQQFLRYYEKELGLAYPELMSKLSDGGVALGLKFGQNASELVLAIQGNDARLSQEFVLRVQRIVDQEMQRQEINQQGEPFSYHGIHGFHLNKDFHIAVVDALVIVSNQAGALEKAIDLGLNKAGKSIASLPALGEARKLLPADLLGWFWVNMETVRKAPNTDALYKKPREFNLEIIAGPILDILTQVSFVTGGILTTPEGLTLTIRLPGGRNMIGPELVLHMPQDPKQSSSLPPLKASQVLYTDTSYFDFEKIWTERARIFPADIVKGLEKADQSTGRLPFLNLQLSKILTSLRPYHRTIVANQNRFGYEKRKPRNPLPAFAIALGLQEEPFGKTLESTLRAAAIFGSQIGLTLAEETYKDIRLVAYRFDETREVPQDTDNIRFNFSPCFCQVGNQFLLSSTTDLAHELIDQLKEENKGDPLPSRNCVRKTVYGPGIADYLGHFESGLVVQSILDQAISPEEAKKQVQIFLSLLRNQGTASVEFAYYPEKLLIDFVIRGKQSGPTFLQK